MADVEVRTASLPPRFVLSCATVVLAVPSYELVSVDFDSVYEPCKLQPVAQTTVRRDPEAFVVGPAEARLTR